jgi:hypothetical protein
MSSASLVFGDWGILRHSRWDALLIALALVQGILICALPVAPVIALGLWWNSNTIAHYFIHKPFFRVRLLNRCFSVYESLLLGVPQELWRRRHLQHHFGTGWSGTDAPLLMLEIGLVAALWVVLAVQAPWFLLTAYAPGYLGGLALCWLHGYYEHQRGTVSHHGTLYNLLFFNDGYHIEHHLHPEEHWTRLPGHADGATMVSRWPAVLRYLDVLSLDGLERCLLRSSFLQKLVLHWHERAFRRLLPHAGCIRHVGIIGGGLFPRTALILKDLLPEARLTVIDMDLNHIRVAQAKCPDEVRFIHDRFDPARVHDLDLLIFPLSFCGDRRSLYQHPPAPTIIVHDWLWSCRGQSARVSILLLKRMNLVRA